MLNDRMTNKNRSRDMRMRIVPRFNQTERVNILHARTLLVNAESAGLGSARLAASSPGEFRKRVVTV